jgi:hypothetical protein
LKGAILLALFAQQHVELGSHSLGTGLVKPVSLYRPLNQSIA